MKDYTRDSACMGAWLFDEGSGLYAYDGSKNTTNDGLVSGADWVVGGGKGFSYSQLSFDGATSYVHLTAHASLEPTSAFSIMGWINLDDVVSNKVVFQRNILLGLDTANAVGDTGHLVYVNFKNNGDNWNPSRFHSNTIITANDVGGWMHIGFTRSGYTSKIYINGNLDNEQSWTAADLTVSATAGAIGRFFGGGWQFRGDMDEVGLFNKALTPDEVSEVYNFGLRGVTYVSSATDTFLDLQSGYARPYWETNITVSGDASTYSGVLGRSYSNENDILSMGSIDRERPFGNSGLSRIIAGDMSLTLNNGSGTYSPLHTGSIFCDAQGSAKDYFNSIINVWAGFENTSGTAYVIQRGSFLLTKLRIDSENRLAYLGCEDAAKLPLQKYIGLPDLSGTAVPWTPPGAGNTKDIIQDILSAVGVSATQYDIASGLDFPAYATVNVKAAEAIAKLAQANDGYIYTNGKGQVVFTRSQTIVFGLRGTDLELKNSDRIVGLTYTQDVNDLIQKTQVNYTTGNAVSRSAEDTSVLKGRQTVIDNDTINQGAIAYSIASRTVGQFKKTRTFLEIDNVWLPGLDLGNVINIYDTNTYQTDRSYEIFRIREDFINCKTKVDAISVVIEKWGFCSDTSATNLAIDQSGGSEFGVSWHSGFAFVSNDFTSVNPGFDLEGNNNNVVNPDYYIPGATGTSGTGVMGIEIPFYMY